MKNVIKLFAISIFVLVTTAVFAQTFGIKAGLNLATIHATDDDGTYNDDLKLNPGFHAGVSAEFPVSGMFSIETGLIFGTKGYRASQKENAFGTTIKTKQSANLFYLDIPINARVNIPVGSSKIFITAGPYVGLGLAGKTTSKIIVNGDTFGDESYTISWGNDENEDDLKRLGFGVAAGAGVQIKAFEIGLSYALGLANTSPYSGNGFKSSNRVLSISLGYKFNRR